MKEKGMKIESERKGEREGENGSPLVCLAAWMRGCVDWGGVERSGRRGEGSMKFVGLN